jgi:hypothetical protein
VPYGTSQSLFLFGKKGADGPPEMVGKLKDFCVLGIQATAVRKVFAIYLQLTIISHNQQLFKPSAYSLKYE